MVLLIPQKREQVLKKILFISHTAELYGAPRSFLSIIKGLDTDMFQANVVCFGTGGFTDEIKKLRLPLFIIPVLRNKQGLWNRLLYKFQKIFGEYLQTAYLVFLLIKIRPELVYVNTISRFAPLLASFLMRKRCVVHVRESKYYFRPNCLQDKIRIYLMKEVPFLYICVSQAIKSLLISEGIQTEKIRTVHNGIDLTYYSVDKYTRKRVRTELHLQDGNLLIGFLGNLTERKGIEFFILVADQLARRYQNIHFLVIGGDLSSSRYKNEITPLVRNKKLQERITFIGMVNDTVPYYSAMDIFCMTSLEEPFARVNLEAMAMLLPVVATDVGGNREQLIDNTTGYIVERNNVELFAQKIETLITNKDLRISMGKAGNKRVQEFFLEEKYVKEINILLKSELL
jgi:glycosyltransferase involved in cell wall biosynthesis